MGFQQSVLLVLPPLQEFSRADGIDPAIGEAIINREAAERSEEGKEEAERAELGADVKNARITSGQLYDAYGRVFAQLSETMQKTHDVHNECSESLNVSLKAGESMTQQLTDIQTAISLGTSAWHSARTAQELVRSCLSAPGLGTYQNRSELAYNDLEAYKSLGATITENYQRWTSDHSELLTKSQLEHNEFLEAETNRCRLEQMTQHFEEARELESEASSASRQAANALQRVFEQQSVDSQLRASLVRGDFDKLFDSSLRASLAER